MVFTGNPGTGKTTVARIVARAFRALGIAKGGQLVETDRSGLVAGYVGQTALKTNKIVDSAMGGVLFIDEAYQLASGGEGDYGKEAIATLIKRMEDARGDIVVILAGYSEDMDRFMALNPGLESRFSRNVTFPDYDAKSLAEIFRRTAKKNRYVLSADVERWLVPYIGVMMDGVDRKKFGNARWARNLFEKTVERQALRVTDLEDPSAEELQTLRLKDLGVKLKDPDASAED
jgi:SpoVK/Ycf46/Vps4 family AAA+-type ATPase